MLEVVGVRKLFGAFAAVDGVDLRLQPRTITGVIGPNGAGKSTLFNLIAGAIAPTSGEIHFEKQRIDGSSPERIFQCGLARTFQIPKPFAQMSVLDNAMVAMAHQPGERFWNNWWRPREVGQYEDIARARALECLGFCGLGDKLDLAAGKLSGGQQKLLELARVMMNEPKLIMLDEPAAGVNPTLLETLIDKICSLRDQGVTVLIIEHNMDMVMRICQYVHVMAQGRMIFSGLPADAQADPQVLDAYLGDLQP